MKKSNILCLWAISLFALFAPVGCGHSHDEHGDHETTEKGEKGERGEKGEHHHGDEIIVEPETAKLFGVETEKIRAGEFHDVIKVTGRIIDSPMSASVVSAPTSGIVRFASGIQEGRQVGAGAVIASVRSEGISGGDVNKTHKAAVDAAKREVDRLKPLFEEGIVSAKDYNAALQEYELAKTQYSGSAASGSARAISGGMISQLLVQNGQYVEAGTPIASISANSRLTLRADVPDRYSDRLSLVKSANISTPNSDEVIDLSKLGGQRVSGGTTTRVTPGYVPVFFSFDSHGKVLPQTMAEVFLIGAKRTGVISVPLEAVVEQQGKHFVFVKVDEEGYEKRPVTLGASDGQRIELKEGVNAGENVVVKGAMTVRLAESNGAVPEGHSHSH